LKSNEFEWAPARASVEDDSVGLIIHEELIEHSQVENVAVVASCNIPTSVSVGHLSHGEVNGGKVSGRRGVKLNPPGGFAGVPISLARDQFVTSVGLIRARAGAAAEDCRSLGILEELDSLDGDPCDGRGVCAGGSNVLEAKAGGHRDSIGLSKDEILVE